MSEHDRTATYQRLTADELIQMRRGGDTMREQVARLQAENNDQQNCIEELLEKNARLKALVVSMKLWLDDELQAEKTYNAFYSENGWQLNPESEHASDCIIARLEGAMVAYNGLKAKHLAEAETDGV